MKKIYQAPQISVLALCVESMLLQASSLKKYTDESGTNGGDALSNRSAWDSGNWAADDD